MSGPEDPRLYSEKPGLCSRQLLAFGLCDPYINIDPVISPGATCIHTYIYIVCVGLGFG